MSPPVDIVCVICDEDNPSLQCCGCGCGTCDRSECTTKTDGYILCGMCAYLKQKSTQDK